MELRRIIDTRIEHMKKLYELSGGVEHDGEKGAFREFLVAELLRPLLPHHFGLGSGVVAEKGGRQSPQIDVIIYDRRLMPPLLLAGDRGIYAIDSVLAVCEVKSCLKAEHYKQAGRAAGHFSPHHPNGLAIATPARDGKVQTWPLFALFSYTADAKEKDEIDRLGEQLPEAQDQATIQLITVLDKGLWMYEAAERRYKKEPVFDRTGALFVLHLLNRIEETAATRGPFRLQDWL